MVSASFFTLLRAYQDRGWPADCERLDAEVLAGAQ
jgi:hypothetical protein